MARLEPIVDWVEERAKQLITSFTCEDVLPDPYEIVAAVEEALIDETGFNLNRIFIPKEQ